MPFDAAIFDFDGTLVDSANAKRSAFFRIFPRTSSHASIISSVLDSDPDGSRNVVIPRMRNAMQRAGLDAALSASELIERYGQETERAVGDAAELPGASDLLAALAPLMELHLCSNTPAETLRRHVKARGWAPHFMSVEGHPAKKLTRVAEVMGSGPFSPHRVAMIGDGISDEEAALANGCAFIAIRAPADLRAAARILGAPGV